MLELSIPPTPVAAPAPAAAGSANATTAATPGAESSGGDDQQGPSFATLLKQQMNAPSAGTTAKQATNPLIDAAAVDPAEETPLPAEFLAALFGLAIDTPAASKPATATDVAAAALAAADGAAPLAVAVDPSMVTPIALPLNAASQMQEQMQLTARKDATAATSSQSSTAILAANPDAAAKSAATTLAAGEEILGASAGESTQTRTDALSQSSQQSQQLSQASANATRIEAPLGSRHWDGEFGNRLAWMVGRQEQRAELVLTPPQLGRIEVSLSVNGDQASAIFTSGNAAVRDAIENALPRLREILTNAGIELGQTHVGSESPQQQTPDRGENRDNRQHPSAAQEVRGLPAGLTPNSPTAWLQSGRGMIDVFA